MSCDVPEDKLWSWVDRNAPELEAHLAQCSKCRARAEEFRTQISGVVADSTPKDVKIPERIGSYRVIRMLGEGGMGVVYEAEQDNPNRAVAVKVVRGGSHVDERHVRLFQREVQALARLRHPAIASIYQAGCTSEGQHFFAMELIRGQPLMEYVRDAKLTINQRLELFTQICEAISYAHQRGVMHRDLKPSNIVIDSDAKPKILDFGLARITETDLAAGTVATHIGSVQGTLAYMSPEQARGDSDAVDVRSDVYSLGVILYELLTGNLPLDVRRMGLAEALALISDQTPAHPSTTVPSARGDLDTIALKALSKERRRRYQSVTSLAEDVNRFLNSEPIAARPPSAAYQLGKLIARHRLAFSFAITVLVIVVLSAGVSINQAFRIAKQRDRAIIAEREAQAAKEAEAGARAEVDAQAESLWRRLYLNRIALAQSAYYQNDIKRMRALLRDCPGELCSWEWYHLLAMSDRSVDTFPRVGLGNCMDVSPDGSSILIGTQDGRVRVLNSSSGFTEYTSQRHARFFRCASFSPDGARFASCADSDNPTIRHAGTGEIELTLNALALQHNVWSLAFSADGSRVVTAGYQYAGEGEARVWDAISGESLLRLGTHGTCINSVAFALEGTVILTAADDGLVKVWDAQNGLQIGEVSCGGRDRGVLAVSPCGTRFVVSVNVRGENGAALVYEVASNTLVTTLRGHTGSVNAVAYSHDGKRIVTGGEDRTVRLWEADTGEQLVDYRGHEDRVIAVVASPTAELLYSLSHDNTVKVWDARASEVQQLEAAPGLSAMAFSPTSDKLATCGAGSTIQVWDIGTGQELYAIEGHDLGETCLAFAPDGSRLAVGSEADVRIFDAVSGDHVSTLPAGATAIVFDEACGRLATATGMFTPSGGDSSTLLRQTPTVLVWDLSSGRVVRSFSLDDRVAKLMAFSSDGLRLVTVTAGQFEDAVDVWNVSSGESELAWTGRDHAVAVHVSGDSSRLICGRWESKLQMWEATTRESISDLASISYEDGDLIPLQTITPDWQRLVTSGRDGVLTLWDVETGEEAYVFRATLQERDNASPRLERTAKRKLALSPNGRHIAVGSESGRVKLWTASAALTTSQPRDVDQAVP